MVGRASSWKPSTVMPGWTGLTKSARRKIRSRSISTITHATEDDDIECQVRASLRMSPWPEGWGQKVECEDASDESDLLEPSQVWRWRCWEFCVKTIEQVIPDLRNTRDKKEGASSQWRARSAGEAPGAHQREREGWYRLERFRSKI